MDERNWRNLRVIAKYSTICTLYMLFVLVCFTLFALLACQMNPTRARDHVSTYSVPSRVTLRVEGFPSSMAKANAGTQSALFLAFGPLCSDLPLSEHVSTFVPPIQPLSYDSEDFQFGHPDVSSLRQALEQSKPPYKSAPLGAHSQLFILRFEGRELLHGIHFQRPHIERRRRIHSTYPFQTKGLQDM